VCANMVEHASSTMSVMVINRFILILDMVRRPQATVL
jgi:hypothetical protein